MAWEIGGPSLCCKSGPCSLQQTLAPTQDAVVLIAPVLQALLIDRLKITFHTETRPLDAPVLTAVKPKLTRTEDSATEHPKVVAKSR